MRKAAVLLMGMTGLALAAPPLPSIHVPAQEKAPHKFILGKGEPAGICPDLLRALQRVEPELRFHGFGEPLSLSLIDQGLRSGQVGAACALLERSERHAYAKRLATPLYAVRHQVLVRSAESARPANLAELLALAGEEPLIVVRGSAYPAQLRALGFRVDDSTGDNQAMLRMLLAGRARFIYGGEHALLRSVQAAGLQDQLRLLPTVFAEEPIYFWTSQQLAAEQVLRIERGLRQLQLSGELARIAEHYHSQP